MQAVAAARFHPPVAGHGWVVLVSANHANVGELYRSIQSSSFRVDLSCSNNHAHGRDLLHHVEQRLANSTSFKIQRAGMAPRGADVAFSPNFHSRHAYDNIRHFQQQQRQHERCLNDGCDLYRSTSSRIGHRPHVLQLTRVPAASPLLVSTMYVGSLFDNREKYSTDGSRNQCGSGPLWTAVAGQAVSVWTARDSVHVGDDDGGRCGSAGDGGQRSTGEEVSVQVLNFTRCSVVHSSSFGALYCL